MTDPDGEEGPPGPPERLGLYVHFPFCAHRCHYCDYAVEPAARPPVESWLQALEGELELRFGKEAWSRPPRVATIYVGGGTPSLLGLPGTERLAELLGRWFRVEQDAEWTVEANPVDVDRATAAGWRRAGVTRVNLGVQSFDDRALRWLGRLHDGAAAERALDAIRTAGLDGLGVDLLYGLPPGLERRLEADLERIRERGIGHVTLYGLTAEAGTPLGRWRRTGRVTLPDEDSLAGAYLGASRLLEEAGWTHYEMTALARPGHRCRHNQRYWSGEPYLGLGPSAHSLLPPWRSWNVTPWREYRNSIARGSLPLESRERLTAEQRETERIWLRLRTRDGIQGALARRLRREASELIQRMVARGWLRATGPDLSPTREGWLRLDDMAAGLAAALNVPPLPGDSGSRRAARPAGERDRRGPIT